MRVRDGDCICNRSPGVTFLDVLGQRVGVSGAEALFARWAAEGLEPERVPAERILAGLRERNYVAEAAAPHYAEAARGAYARWRGERGEAHPR